MVRTDGRSSKKIQDSFITVIKAVFLLFIAVSVIGFIIYNTIDKTAPLEYSDPVYIENWTVTDPSGNVSKEGISYVVDKVTEQPYVIESVLPAVVSDDSRLCFITSKDVDVYINGELREDFKQKRDVAFPGGCVKRFYMTVALDASDAGDMAISDPAPPECRRSAPLFLA